MGATFLSLRGSLVAPPTRRPGEAGAVADTPSITPPTMAPGTPPSTPPGTPSSAGGAGRSRDAAGISSSGLTSARATADTGGVVGRVAVTLDRGAAVRAAGCGGAGGGGGGGGAMVWTKKTRAPVIGDGSSSVRV